MSRVRVFVPTFRRARLLRRALESLRAQTHRDWVAEVHNDDPEDPAPAALVASMNDERMSLVQHDRNLGGTVTFNLFFRHCEEPYLSILEDDNWWQPTFLEEMVCELAACPEVSVAWSNMRIWRESAEGDWSDTGTFTWPGLEHSQKARKIAWGDPRQALGAMHSNGAMLARAAGAAVWQIPVVEFAAIEAVRERAFPHPMLLVPRPLANFSQTIESHRRDDRGAWGSNQALLVASYAEAWSGSAGKVRELWELARALSPGTTSALLIASFQHEGLRVLRTPARVSEWLRFLASSVRHPIDCARMLSARRRNAGLWNFLVEHTRRRVNEAQQGN